MPKVNSTNDKNYTTNKTGQNKQNETSITKKVASSVAGKPSMKVDNEVPTSSQTKLSKKKGNKAPALSHQPPTAARSPPNKKGSKPAAVQTSPIDKNKKPVKPPALPKDKNQSFTQTIPAMDNKKAGKNEIIANKATTPKNTTTMNKATSPKPGKKSATQKKKKTFGERIKKQKILEQIYKNTSNIVTFHRNLKNHTSIKMLEFNEEKLIKQLQLQKNKNPNLTYKQVCGIYTDAENNIKRVAIHKNREVSEKPKTQYHLTKEEMKRLKKCIKKKTSIDEFIRIDGHAKAIDKAKLNKKSAQQFAEFLYKSANLTKGKDALKKKFVKKCKKNGGNLIYDHALEIFGIHPKSKTSSKKIKKPSNATTNDNNNVNSSSFDNVQRTPPKKKSVPDKPKPAPKQIVNLDDWISLSIDDSTTFGVAPPPEEVQPSYVKLKDGRIGKIVNMVGDREGRKFLVHCKDGAKAEVCPTEILETFPIMVIVEHGTKQVQGILKSIKKNSKTIPVVIRFIYDANHPDPILDGSGKPLLEIVRNYGEGWQTIGDENGYFGIWYVNLSPQCKLKLQEIHHTNSTNSKLVVKEWIKVMTDLKIKKIENVIDFYQWYGKHEFILDPDFVANKVKCENPAYIKIKGREEIGKLFQFHPFTMKLFLLTSSGETIAIDMDEVDDVLPIRVKFGEKQDDFPNEGILKNIEKVKNQRALMSTIQVIYNNADDVAVSPNHTLVKPYDEYITMDPHFFQYWYVKLTNDHKHEVRDIYKKNYQDCDKYSLKLKEFFTNSPPPENSEVLDPENFYVWYQDNLRILDPNYKIELSEKVYENAIKEILKFVSTIEELNNFYDTSKDIKANKNATLEEIVLSQKFKDSFCLPDGQLDEVKISSESKKLCEKICETHCFENGNYVIAIEDFHTNGEPSEKIKKGTILEIMEVDIKNDLAVNKIGKDRSKQNQWIFPSLRKSIRQCTKDEIPIQVKSKPVPKSSSSGSFGNVVFYTFLLLIATFLSLIAYLKTGEINRRRYFIN